MAAFVKLDQGILLSSIWSESPEVRVVWITLLAMSDQHGMVPASATGIAKMAGLQLETVTAALDMFQAPDQHSRTPDDEGRRIARVDGGYVLLNYAKYRDAQDIGERREHVKAATRKWREKRRVIAGDQSVIDVISGDHLRSRSRSEAENVTDSGDATAPRPRKPRKLPVESSGAVAEACDDWTAAIGGTAPGKRIAGAWPALLRLAQWSDVRPVWRWYLEQGKASGKAEFCNPQEFAGKFGYWRDRSNGLQGPPRAGPRAASESQVDAYDRAMEQLEREVGVG